MNLPKLYSPVTIEFDSLRNGIGAGGGVIFDIDTKVHRKCMRVLHEDSWVWQIVNYCDLLEWDYFAYTDQEILLMYGPEVEAVVIS